MSRKDTRVRDRREYNHAHYESNHEILNLRRARLYYLTNGTMPRPRSVLGRWCAEHGLDVGTVIRDGIPDLS